MDGDSTIVRGRVEGFLNIRAPASACSTGNQEHGRRVPVQIDVLGPLRVLDDAGRALPVGGRKPRALLGALIARRGRVVSAAELAAVVWPESLGGPAVNSAQVQIAAVRRRCGRDLIVTVSGGYQIGPTVDLVHDRFVDVVRNARAPDIDPMAADAAASAALRLWRGDPLSDCDCDPAADELRRSLLSARASAREVVVTARLSRGTRRGASQVAEAMTIDEPLDERGWELYLRALRSEGRRAEALKAYARLRQLLLDELGSEPSAPLRLLHNELLAEERRSGAVLWPGDAPTATDPFVGRVRELAELKALTTTNGLVTVTGPGGAGKTRLVWEHLARRTDNVRVTVPCSTAVTSHQALEQLAHRVLVGPPTGGLSDAVVNVLRSLQPVLVLDNLEQVDDVAQFVSGLLRDVPGLSILATSRTALGLPGEAVLSLGGLPVPAGDTTEEVLASPAGELFVARARAAVPDFRPARHAREVSAICRGLDGLPLGLEIAAARLQLYAAEELARDVEALVAAHHANGTAQRQVSLSATVDWSYRLLDEDAARGLRHLGAFAGSATADSLAAVLGTDARHAGGLLEELTRQSLAVREPSGRFRLLGTVRAVALNHLNEEGELYSALSRLDGWCLRSCQKGIGDDGLPCFADLTETAAFFDDEATEVAAALHRLADIDRDRWVDLLISCWGPWWQLGRTGQLVPMLKQALDLLPSWHARSVDVRLCLGVLDANEGRLERATKLLDQVLHAHDRTPAQEALAGVFRAYVCLASGEPGEARRRSAAAFDNASTCGVAWVHAWSLLMEALVAQAGGDISGMIACHEQARTIARESGAKVIELGALTNLSTYLLASGREEDAGPVRAEALLLARDLRYAELEAALVADTARADLMAGRIKEARANVDRCAATMLRVSRGRWLAELVQLQAAVAAAEGDVERSRTLTAGQQAWTADAGWALAAAPGALGAADPTGVRPEAGSRAESTPELADLVRLGMGTA
jgi:predicted ATPase/DNA-binding winged helix-turn-helix (wHTH) protein